MKFIATTAALVSIIPGIFGLTINTPTGVVQCQPILINYGQGTAPYYFSIIPGGQVSGAPLKTWDPTSATSITWNVDIAAGTSISLAIKDSTGAQAYSDRVIIQTSSDSTCLNGSPSGTASAAVVSTDTAFAAASATAASAAFTSAGTSRATTASSVASHASSSSSSRTTTALSSSKSDATSATSGAFRLDVAGFCIAGAVGLIGAMIL